jgi:hypothetical protein
MRTTQTATEAVRTVRSEPDGGYVLSNLSLRPCRLEVSKDGFSSDPLINPGWVEK